MPQAGSEKQRGALQPARGDDDERSAHRHVELGAHRRLRVKRHGMYSRNSPAILCHARYAAIRYDARVAEPLRVGEIRHRCALLAPVTAAKGTRAALRGIT